METNNNIQNFVRWSKDALPGGDRIANLPTISLQEFIDAINGNDHTPYREDAAGKKYNPGIFNTNDTLFLDIDHIDDYFEAIWEKLDDIIAACPFIALVKQSRSKSLHFICVGHWNNIEEHVERDMFYLACVAKAILKITGIDLREEEKALDVHTKSCEQRLFVYDPKQHPYKVNPFPTAITLDGIEKAFEEYPMLKPAPKTSAVMVENFDGIFDARKRRDSEKITLDRNYCICGYYGNDARWRVANVLAYLCNGNLDAAKSIIQNNFSNPCDFSFASVSKGINHSVLNWVMSNLQTKYGGDCGGYLAEKMDEIVKFVGLHPHSLLVAPTGSGKTTLVNGIKGGFDGLAKRLNAVVVTPFNNMLHLYDSMTAIKSNPKGGANVNDYRSDEPCVIIWDQVNKLIKKIIEDDRTVIIDESHTLFLDRDYRDSAVRLMHQLKDVRKVIAITATPTGEERELNLERLEYRSHKGLVDTTLRYTKSNVGTCMLGDIIYNTNHSEYDRIVVFSDQYVRRLHENLDARLIPHAFIHSKNRNGEDFKLLQEKEILTERVTLCTSLAYNGLNFKNENENVLVLMDCIEGQTLASHIIQCVGRLRRSAVTLKMYMIDAGNQPTVEQKKFQSDLVTNSIVDSSIVSVDVRYIDENVVSAMRSIEDYSKEHGSFESIKKELKETEYFVIREVYDEEGKDPINAQLVLKEKRAMEEAWLQGFLQGFHSMDEAVSNNEYYLAVDRQMRNLIWEYAIRPEVVREILKNKKGDKLVSTVFEELRKKCQLNTYTDEEYKRMVSSIERWIRENKVELGDAIVKQFKSNLRDMKKWRERYIGDGVNIAVGDMVRMIEVTDEDLALSLQDTFERRSKAHSAPRKAYKKKMYRCEDGFEGTKTEIAAHFSKGESTIERWITNGKVIPIG